MQKERSNVMEGTYCNRRIEASPLCLPFMNDHDQPAVNAVDGGTPFSHYASVQQEYVQIENLKYRSHSFVPLFGENRCR